MQNTSYGIHSWDSHEFEWRIFLIYDFFGFVTKFKKELNSTSRPPAHHTTHKYATLYQKHRVESNSSLWGFASHWEFLVTGGTWSVSQDLINSLKRIKDEVWGHPKVKHEDSLWAASNHQAPLRSLLQPWAKCKNKIFLSMDTNTCIV